MNICPKIEENIYTEIHKRKTVKKEKIIKLLVFINNKRTYYFFYYFFYNKVITDKAKINDNDETCLSFKHYTYRYLKHLLSLHFSFSVYLDFEIINFPISN